MEQLTIGTATFNAYPNNLDDALDAFRMLKDSCDAGWNAFFKIDYEFSAFVEFVRTKAPKLLKEWENRNVKENNGKTGRGNRRASRKNKRSCFVGTKKSIR